MPDERSLFEITLKEKLSIGILCEGITGVMDIRNLLESNRGYLEIGGGMPVSKILNICLIFAGFPRVEMNGITGQPYTIPAYHEYSQIDEITINPDNMVSIHPGVIASPVGKYLIDSLSGPAKNNIIKFPSGGTVN